MDPNQIQAWLALLGMAMTLGEAVYADVKGVMDRQLTPEENAAVLAQWDENEMRSRRDAGLPLPPSD